MSQPQQHDWPGADEPVIDTDGLPVLSYMDLLGRLAAAQRLASEARALVQWVHDRTAHDAMGDGLTTPAVLAAYCRELAAADERLGRLIEQASV